MSATDERRGAGVHPDDDASEAEQREAEALARALEGDALVDGPCDASEALARVQHTAHLLRSSTDPGPPLLDALAFERVRGRLRAPAPSTARARGLGDRRPRRTWVRFTGASLALAASVAAVWLVVRAASEAPQPTDSPALEYALLFTAPLMRDERPVARIERMLARYQPAKVTR